MAEEESEDMEVEEETVEGQDDDLYAVVSGKPKASSIASSIVRHEDDDTPFHKIEFMHDVPLRLSVEIGQTHLSVREILGLKVGNVIEFSKVVGEPMDITVSGRLMARGEVVVVNERYGVRISEVTRPDETETSTSRDN